MRRTWLIGVVAAVALSVPLAGCSDGDESSGPTTTAAGASRTTSNDPYCRSLQSFNQQFSEATTPNLAEPDQFRASMQEAVAAAKEAEAAAPEELKADLAVLNGGLQQLLALFEQVGFDITKLQLAQVQQLQAQPELTAAGARVSAYEREHCT